ncbi:MAG: hypothetical protein VST70_05085 [Nitrospirota bacterium]|nr:hypothetical protein [Nitrospirota bacterium]
MKISLTLDDLTYDLILQDAGSRLPPVPYRTPRLVDRAARRLILETIMNAFPSDLCLCEKCGKAFSVEGRVREEGAFCNRHLPKEMEEV